MSILVVSRHSIELAQCANLEILAVMPLIFDCFESAEAGQSLVRSLQLYQQGLEGLSTEMERATLDEMIAAHAEIRAAFVAAADVARFPFDLVTQVIAAFDDFAIGLKDLEKTPSVAAHLQPSP